MRGIRAHGPQEPYSLRSETILDPAPSDGQVLVSALAARGRRYADLVGRRVLGCGGGVYVPSAPPTAAHARLDTLDFHRRDARGGQGRPVLLPAATGRTIAR